MFSNFVAELLATALCFWYYQVLSDSHHQRLDLIIAVTLKSLIQHEAAASSSATKHNKIRVVKTACSGLN